MEKNNQVMSQQQLISLFDSSPTVDLSCMRIIEYYLFIWCIFHFFILLGKRLGAAGAKMVSEILKTNSFVQILDISSNFRDFWMY